jgi:hypothetical protein
MQEIATSETWDSKMDRLAEAVHESDAGFVTAAGGLIRARWEAGHHMLIRRDDKKRLPNRMLDHLAAKYGRSRSDLGAWMKFAVVYPTELELATAVELFHTWTGIKQLGLRATLRLGDARMNADAGDQSVVVDNGPVGADSTEVMEADEADDLDTHEREDETADEDDRIAKATDRKKLVRVGKEASSVTPTFARVHRFALAPSRLPPA